jgi:hypothetical protein
MAAPSKAPLAALLNPSAEWPAFSAESFAVVSEVLTAVDAASAADATALLTLSTKPEKVLFIHSNLSEE